MADAPERDPRTDPMPGDVRDLRVGQEWRKGSERRLIIFVWRDRVGYRPLNMRRTRSVSISEFRKWAATAEVVTRAEEKQNA